MATQEIYTFHRDRAKLHGTVTSHYICTAKLPVLSSHPPKTTSHTMIVLYKFPVLNPKLPEATSRTPFAPQSCEFQAQSCQSGQGTRAVGCGGCLEGQGLLQVLPHLVWLRSPFQGCPKVAAEVQLRQGSLQPQRAAGRRGGW